VRGLLLARINLKVLYTNVYIFVKLIA